MSFLIELDHTLFLAINRGIGAPWFDAPMQIISHASFSVALAGILVGWAIGRRRYDMLLVFLVVGLAVMLSDLLAYQVFKPYFSRHRPCHAFASEIVRTVASCGGRFGFPSNHATNAFTVAALLWLFLGKTWGGVAVGVAIAISFSRIYLGVHYPADIFAGMVLGVAVGMCFYFATRKYLKLPAEINENAGSG